MKPVCRSRQIHSAAENQPPARGASLRVSVRNLLALQ